MPTLKQLRATRGQEKAKITRFRTFLDSCDESNINQLPERISKAEKTYKDFEETQEQIELLRDMDIVEQRDVEIKERDEFESLYYAAIANAKEKLGNTVESAAGVSTPKTNLKLPTLKLPTFNRSYDQWLLFKDTFDTIINSNKRLSSIEKFQYLRSSLEGEAMQVIQSLETSSGNYQVAWEALIQRYENKRLIVYNHVKELFELPQIVKGNHTALRPFIDQLRTNLRVLEMLKQPVTSWDTMLIYLTTGKLDYHIRREWEQHVSSLDSEELPTFNQLVDFLTNQCQTMEMVEHGKPRQELKLGYALKKSEKGVSLASTMTTKCWYCSEEHYINRCNGFLKLPVESKRDEVQKLMLCWNCLRKGHSSKDCQSSACKTCSGKHHTLLHVEGRAPASSGSSTVSQNETLATHYAGGNQEEYEVYESSTEHTDPLDTIDLDRPIIVGHCSPASKQTQVLLSTALISVYDVDGKEHTCRALLDPGSQINLVTEELVT